MLVSEEERKKKVALIHVAKKELCLDDDTYRDLLDTSAGVRSAADLKTAEQFKAVLNAFRLSGFKIQNQIAGYKIKNPQLAKCFALWCDLHKLGAVRNKSYKALMAYLAKLLGDQDIYRRDQLAQAIESLKAWQQRVSKEVPPAKK